MQKNFCTEICEKSFLVRFKDFVDIQNEKAGRSLPNKPFEKSRLIHLKKKEDERILKLICHWMTFD